MAEAFAPSVASNLVSKLGEYLFAPIGRQFGYVLCYKSHVKDLKKGVEKLEGARERVQHSVQEAKNNGKPIENDIKNWLERVENEATQAGNLLQDGESAKNACFCGWLPNPVVRHPIGRKMKKMTQVIQRLHDESQKDIFHKVYYEDTPTGVDIASTSTTRFVDKKEDVMESRASITEDIIKAIADDKVCVIGVHGLGGVGKSKLLEDFKRRVEEEKLFDMVVMVKLSRNPDLKEIQGEIAYKLGLKLTNDEPASERASRLCKRLESDSEKKILIILDNLWKKLELNEVGIPCGDDNKVRGCKLLLSSRNKDVLRIDMGSDREFPLTLLEHGEARKLFERVVGDSVNNSEFEPHIDGAVKNCGGLPLSIVSVAKRLKHKDLAAWRIASTSRDLLDGELIVKLSYDDLKDIRVKSLFLLCALTSGRIHTGDYLIYCMGLGLFKEFGNPIQKARDRLINDLHSLQDYSLLLGSEGMELFRMHDIFVDGAICMDGEVMDLKWKALVGKKDYGFEDWSEDDLRKCTAISLSYVGIDELPEKLDCPNLRMLLLLENHTSLKIPESFFESMEMLQVLHLAGLSFNSLTSSIQFLKHLKSLSLNFCRLEDVTILGKLKKLQFLSFAKSTIVRLPKEIGELTKLRFLDLKFCFRLQIIEPGMLGSLINLEELYIDESFRQWEAEDAAPRSNASLAELKNMKKLRTLYIAIPHSTNLSSDLPFGNLHEHKILIGGIWPWWGQYTESRSLRLKLDTSNLLHEVWMQECLGRTQDLHLDGLQDGKDSIQDLCTKGFQELKHLHVENSLSFHHIIGSTQGLAFARLESLVLKGLNKLEKICRNCLDTESLSKLKIVKVEYCGEIRYLFPSSMTKMFLQLEEIKVTKCQFMQHIVVDAKVDDYIGEVNNDANVKLCKLRRLTLQDLPEMMSFCKTKDHSVVLLDGQQVSLPSLESLTLSALPKLKEIWNSQFSSDVSNLKYVEVKDCAFLLSIFPSNLVKKLQNLEAITIERCQLIRVVFELKGSKASGDVEILPRLMTLTLSDLPNLGHIWNKIPRIALCFRNLRVLKVQNCENLRFVFSSSMAKSLRQIKEIKIGRCKLLEKIIDVQEEESEEAGSIDTLEFPLLSSLFLEELSNLRTFSYGMRRIHCPTLTRLMISECPRMMTFSSSEGKQQRITADAGLQQTFGGVNSSLSLPILFDQNVLFPSLENLTLVSLRGLMKIWHNELFEESFCKLTSVTVQDCENLSHIFPSTLVEGLRSSGMIEVVNCTSLESLIEHIAVNTKTRPESLVFSGMKGLKLQDLPRLNALVTSSSQVTSSLPSLTNVSLSNCHSLRYLFTYHTSRTLDKLEMLDVSDCNKMQEVVATEESRGQNLMVVKFSHLRKLKLRSLKSLISFSSGRCAYEFPSLRDLSILECTELKAFILRLPAPRVKTVNEGSTSFDESPYSLFDEKVPFPSLENLTLVSLRGLMKIWHNEHFEESFCKLARVTVRDCENLSHIFPSTLVEGLWSSGMIEVVNCTSLESLIEHVAVNTKTRRESLVFSGMKGLKLQDLPRLNALVTSSSQVTLSLPSLTNVSLSNCHSLRYLFTYHTSRTLDKLEMLDVSDCNKMQEVVATEESRGQNLMAVKFSHLRTLKLRSLKSLISFSSGRCAYEFPSLRDLSILECTELKAFILRLPAPRVETVNEGSTSFDESPYSLFDEKVPFPSLENLTLVSLRGLMKIWHNEHFEESFCKLARVTIRDCENLSHIFSSTLVERLQDCEKLSPLFPSTLVEGLWSSGMIEVVNCTSLESLIEHVAVNTKTRRESLVFSGMKGLKLQDLPRLNALVTSSSQVTLSLPSLTNVSLSNCHSLRYLFTYHTSRTLDKLEMLDVSDCNKMQEVVATEESRGQNLMAVKFSHLRTLKFRSLKSLISFSSGRCAYEFPSLRDLSILECTELKAFILRLPAPRVESVNEGSTSFDESPCSLFDEKVEFPSMESMKISHMDNIEKIWLDELASNAFTKLKKLIVEYCEKLSSIFSSDSILTRFQSLEKLKVTNCGSLEVVFQIQELNLGGTHSTSTFQLRKLKLEQLPKMKHVWSGHPCGTLTFEHLRCLEAKNCESLKSLFPVSVAKSMTRLERLLLRDCGLEEIIREEDGVGTSASGLFFPQLIDLPLAKLPELRSFYRNSHTLTWPLLKELIVIHCSKMRTFSFACEFQSCQSTTTIEIQPALFFFGKVIPNLEKLALKREDVAMLPQHYIFANLKSLILGCYHDENIAFPSAFLLQGFPNIEVLVVECSSFEEIFPEDALGHGGVTTCGGLTDAEKPLKSLGNLKQLELIKLHNLRGVWKHGSLMAEILKQIAFLSVYQCPSLSIVFPSPASFQRLMQLEVKECAGLVHMGTYSAMTSLVYLTWLTLRDCGAMEDVVTDDGDGAEEIPFPELEELILDHLPSLESFSPTNCAFKFPLLRRVVITQCPKMDIFCKGALRTPKVDKVFLFEEDGEGRWEGDLNTTVQTLSTWNDPHRIQ